MSDETRETLLHSQLQEGLSYRLMQAPAVSGSHGYPELCLATRNEERRLVELAKRRQYLRTGVSFSYPGDEPPRHQVSGPEPTTTGDHPPRQGFNTQTREPESRRCYNCEMPGHYARDWLAQQTNRSGSDEPGGWTGRDQGVARSGRGRGGRFNRDQGASEQGGRPREDKAEGSNKQIQSSVNPPPPQQFDSPLDAAMMSSLIPSSSDEEGVLQVRIPYGGSRQQHVDILLAGVPDRGVIDSGSDITIVGCETFQRVAAAARLPHRMMGEPLLSMEEWI